MPDISEYTRNIEEAVLGEEVRGSIVSALNEMNNVVDTSVAETSAMVSSPLQASTVADMEDTTKIYVYTGEETGYDTGHWYYYDGTEWVRGGPYQSAKYDYDDLQNAPAIVVVDDDEPSDDRTNIWFDPTGEEVEVPTMEEFEEVRGLEDVIDEYLVTKDVSAGTDVATSDLFTLLSDITAQPNAGYRNRITLTSNDNYDSYYFVLQEPTEVYFSANTFSQYVAISYGENYDRIEGNYVYCASGVITERKRGSENNLPTQDEPLSLGTGAVIVITVKKGYTVDIYGLEKTYRYADALVEKIEEVANVDAIKRAKVVYDNAVTGANTERLYIYLPAKSGYIRYNFEHYENQDKNADIWLVHPVYTVTDSLETDRTVTVAGEFECAIKIRNAPDFMGGSTHGSEIMQSIHFFLDGKMVEPEEITELTEFSLLRIVEHSYFYDPTDETTFAATHGKEYIFDGEKLTINQSVKWVNDFSLVAGYMAMLPVAKAVSPYYIPNDTYQTYEAANEYIRRGGITSVISFDGDILVKFAIPLWEMVGTNLTDVGVFYITDNSTPNYNKQYYICTSGGSVSEGDLWKTTTVYVIEAN